MSSPFFNFTVSYPGDLLERSFLDLTVTNSSIFPAGTVLDAWCLDKSIDVDSGGAYAGYVYSAYEPPTIGGVLPNIAGYVDHLDSVNWLLNFYDGSNPQYNWGEVQAAIWTLMGQSYQTELNYIQTGGVVLDADVQNLVTHPNDRRQRLLPVQQSGGGAIWCGGHTSHRLQLHHEQHRGRRL